MSFDKAEDIACKCEDYSTCIMKQKKLILAILHRAYISSDLSGLLTSRFVNLFVLIILSLWKNMVMPYCPMRRENVAYITL